MEKWKNNIETIGEMHTEFEFFIKVYGIHLLTIFDTKDSSI